MALNEVQKYLATKSQIEFWNLHQIQVQRRESYLCLGKDKKAEANQSRIVNSQDLFLEVWLKKADGNLGKARTRLIAGDALAPQVEKLLGQAQLASEKFWAPIPLDKTSKLMDVKSCSPNWIEDFGKASDELKVELIQEINKTSTGLTDAQFNSSELFCTLESHQVVSSNGYENKFYRSKIYAEVCFSANKDAASDEFLVTQWSVRPEDLSLSRLCQKSLEGARGMLKASQTPTGQYTVQLPANDLALILESVKERLSGSSKYLGMPFFEENSDFIPGFKGDAFELVVNPLKDWALNAAQADFWGRPCKELHVVSKNKVKANLYSQKFAQYLEHEPTISDGVLEVRPMATTALPKGKEPILEILQFSGLFVDGVSLTFSSEIRLAKWVGPDGSTKYFKGGNLSGSLKGNFLKVKWGPSQEMVSIEGEYSFYGPSFALLNQVSIS